MGSVTSVFFGLYAYLLPFVLYAAWVTIALWDLLRSNPARAQDWMVPRSFCGALPRSDPLLPVRPIPDPGGKE